MASNPRINGIATDPARYQALIDQFAKAGVAKPDANGDGHLSKVELTAVFDQNGDGTIQFDEITAFHKAVGAESYASAATVLRKHGFFIAGTKLLKHIDKTTWALTMAKVPMLHERGPMQRTHPQYMADVSDQLYQSAQQQFEQNRNRPISALTPKHVASAVQYAKTHKVGLVIVHGTHDSGDGYRPVSSRNGHMQFGLAARAPSLEYFQKSLRHEHGHIRDEALLMKQAPKLKKLIETGMGSRQDVRDLTGTFYQMVLQNIPTAQRANFQKAWQRYIGNAQNIPEEQLGGKLKMLYELFRYGEEAYTPSMVSRLLLPDMNHFKKRPAGEEHPPLTDTSYVMLAAMQEGGVWDQFKALHNFDPASLQGLDQTKLKFFRMILRANRQYFPSTEKAK